MEKICVGKIVNTFGIKGELKIVSSFEYAKRAFKINNYIFIAGEKHLITSSRYHHYNYLVGIDNINDINKVTILIGNDVYINRDELNLCGNEYLFEDLINLSVYSDDKYIGIVSDVYTDKVNPLIKVNGFYIPINGYVKCVDLDNKRIMCSDVKELML